MLLREVRYDRVTIESKDKVRYKKLIMNRNNNPYLLRLMQL